MNSNYFGYIIFEGELPAVGLGVGDRVGVADGRYEGSRSREAMIEVVK